jgi:flagellin
MTVIASNVAALRAQNASNTANAGLQQAMERLSTGKRINSAKDDAAGLAIATKMNSEVRGLTAARRNANDGISLAQTAEGGLGDISNMLQRMKELSIQAANGTNDSAAAANLQTEVSALLTQVDKVAGQKFNGVSLFSGTATDIQVGTSSGDTVQVNAGKTDTTALGINGIDISSATGASSAMGLIDTAIDTVSTARANMGAVQSRLESAASNLTSTITNLTDAKSRIEDADFSEESTALAKNQILTQASTAMLAQANQSQQGVLKLLS